MKLEEYLKSRISHQDLASPPDHLWNEINKQWKKPAKKSNMWKYAAVLFISSSIGLSLYSLKLKNQVAELASLSDVSEEYALLEENYQIEISRLESGLALEQVSQHEEYKWIIEELGFLDEINIEYRKDIGRSMDEDQLVRVLIDYYEKKIRILRKLELEIKRAETKATTVDPIS